jgi:hypothetical protein
MTMKDVLRIDAEILASEGIDPARAMAFDEYQALLAQTRSKWQLVESE